MIDLVKYKGYYRMISYSETDGLFFAEAVGIGNSLIICHGDTTDDVRKNPKFKLIFIWKSAKKKDGHHASQTRL